ncbi:MAG TPA: peptide chain release factor N(5)-glutamine methyltransferase [Longimicrobiales bacterium]|nr:peptide chain release factor N(5)-glutamine methyltransferase [Longimicrobiales bacterium]
MPGPEHEPGPLIELTRKAAGVFAERGFENARLEAELLLAGVLGMKRLDLYLQHDRPLTDAELERFRVAVRRRLKHEPLQYVLGTAAFRRLELYVDQRVLIPRPETEVLAGAVLDWARTRAGVGAALDIGTGSGAIALSLAGEGSFTRVVATDVSSDALAVAQQNAHRVGLADRVELRHGSLFEPLLAGETFTVIVSNPPYIAESERATLAPEVVAHEPAAALFAGADGLNIIDALLRGAHMWLEPRGLLALEIGATQGDAVLRRAHELGRYENARVVHDLSGRPRVVLAERA